MLGHSQAVYVAPATRHPRPRPCPERCRPPCLAPRRHQLYAQAGRCRFQAAEQQREPRQGAQRRPVLVIQRTCSHYRRPLGQQELLTSHRQLLGRRDQKRLQQRLVGRQLRQTAPNAEPLKLRVAQLSAAGRETTRAVAAAVMLLPAADKCINIACNEK